MNTPSVAPFAQAMQDAARSVSLPGSGLAWLDAARHEALSGFLARGLPDARNELWKYTSLRALEQRHYAARDEDAASRPVDPAWLPGPARAGCRVVFVNGAYRPDLSKVDDLPDGIDLLPLSRALRDRPEPLRFLLSARSDVEEDGFTLLNRAMAADGVVIRVAAGVHMAEPLHVVHVGAAAATAFAWHLRNLTELGEGAQLGLVEHYVGEGGHLGNVVHEVNLRDRARLAWTVVQCAAANAELFRRTDARLQGDATLDFHALELGGRLTRHELRVDLDGARSRFVGHGAFVLHERQRADNEVLVTHRGRDACSDSAWRGVADGRARGVVHGRILVLPGADGANGGFYNKNLLLSPDAEIDTRPALEIYADEVQANHGATVGQLDEHVLFYLQSRGIPLDAARRMLVRAFCMVALDGIEPAALREHCNALLSAQMPEALP